MTGLCCTRSSAGTGRLLFRHVVPGCLMPSLRSITLSSLCSVSASRRRLVVAVVRLVVRLSLLGDDELILDLSQVEFFPTIQFQVADLAAVAGRDVDRLDEFHPRLVGVFG